MLKLGRDICFCLLFISCLHAQQPQPGPTTTDLQQWLRSGDPRQIAWAAHYVAENGEKVSPGTLAVMAEVLDKERTSADPNALAPAASQHDHYEAVAALLDAFIQQKAPPSNGIISTVAHTFPMQAVLLASYLPITRRNSLLESFYSFRDYDSSGRLSARLATMMSADDPSPALAASLINEAEEHLTIVVRKTPMASNGTGTNMCGDSWSTAIRPNWPVVYTYQFEENATGTRDTLLVAVDDDRITYRRVPDNDRGGSCNGVRWLDAGTRHRLIAHWLGIPERSMTWSTRSFAVILWTTRGAYLAKLAEAVEQHHEALQATVRALVAKHVLHGEKATSVQPRLIVNIVCEMDPCPLGGGRTELPTVDPSTI